jgi:hypothetical protein
MSRVGSIRDPIGYGLKNFDPNLIGSDSDQIKIIASKPELEIR